MYDVVIIGGGPAGLSAALVLGRSCRRVLVLDAGNPRNAPSPAAHSMFTRDGDTPQELLRIGREQLRPYDVELRTAEVTDVVQEEAGFAATLADGSRVSARRVLLSTGVMDRLPEIEGVRELWGKAVLHCPYCHGWEVRNEPVAVYANGETALELAPLVLCWSRDVVLCTGGPAEFPTEERERLERNGIVVREERVIRLEGKDGHLERIVFEDGTALARSAMFLRTFPRQHSDLPEKLGCDFTSVGLVQVDSLGKTSVPGVYAAGDLALRIHQVVVAAADGAIAGIAINHDLMTADLVE